MYIVLCTMYDVHRTIPIDAFITTHHARARAYIHVCMYGHSDRHTVLCTRTMYMHMIYVCTRCSHDVHTCTEYIVRVLYTRTMYTRRVYYIYTHVVGVDAAWKTERFEHHALLTQRFDPREPGTQRQCPHPSDSSAATDA